jgi:hypothetical protein
MDETKVTVVSVKFSRRLDLGYPPYIKYLQTLGTRTPPFGTRDNSNMELDLYISAELGEGGDVDEAARELLVKARSIMDQNIGLVVPAAILNAGVPDEAFIVDKTEITRAKVDF